MGPQRAASTVRARYGCSSCIIHIILKQGRHTYLYHDAARQKQRRMATASVLIRLLHSWQEAQPSPEDPKRKLRRSSYLNPSSNLACRRIAFAHMGVGAT
ncbi:hypothetical protein PISMIDRAFT_671641 [Pisolithus microcarpus 441]|uniref:Uncharacterized protein n=1 Tax=Pisolithus microcarpus 441 TaxID=765257 RepID=A0A0C9YX65_9AGAM|nr:hypothetical protein PISMIDRAFT_671641 [Pisolithus microcarpus 441]